MTSPGDLLDAYARALSHDPPQEASPAGERAADSGMVDGARFILDRPATVPAVWGKGTQVLWAEGEALMIAGGQGLGKTTLAGQLVRALLGVGDGAVLGLPVACQGEPLLYLAMDRPRQIARSLGRQFTEADRAALGGLLVRPGPPPADMAAHPLLLAGMAAEFDAKVVVVDSLKDAAIGLSDDQVAAAYNRARQALLNTGVQLLELHHVVKRGAHPGGPINSVADIYGSTWLTSGSGSVVLLHGEPGDPIVGFRHVKQPAEEVGPWRLLHDQAAGVLTVEHSVDLVALVKAGGPDGLTAKGAAQAITEKPNPSRADVEKARRRLDQLAAAGVLVRLEGSRGGGESRQTAAWFPAKIEQSHSITGSDKTAGQGKHALFDLESNHAAITLITPETETAGQGNHAPCSSNHARSNHETTTPFKGVVSDATDRHREATDDRS
ncbi:AAA family ATPase [Mycobacterium marinum]|uniref:AAA family ATPase n=1 Tax=Mycobacterium marinum TaxID=1781 RepID=UPI00235858E9|nr:AAA family ATPase [Mycobacterium marinum]MDC9006474.1 AAA family ATPase [Mycobacterium marinum]